jgi:putative phage-type endonuclease
MVAMSYKYNTTCSVTGLLDKCINKKFSDAECVKIVNSVFDKNITKKDVLKRKSVHAKNKVHIDTLKKIPHVEQKSPEWYEIRRNLITASDFAQALGEGKFGTQKQLYKKKCGYEEEAFNASLPPLKWGNMFEFVAQTIYAQRNNVDVHEFGIIKHPTLNYFGASPDGITDNGIMLEIKCPFKRKINGEIPQQYYYQIQGQLDVCGLEECDYFECEFIDLGDVPPVPAECDFEYGAIIELEDLKYVYSPVKTEWKKNELETWVKDNSKEGDIIHYYKLHVCNTIRVEKDESFIREKLDLLKEVWDKIAQYRSDETLYKNEICKVSKYGRSLKIDDYVL